MVQVSKKWGWWLRVIKDIMLESLRLITEVFMEMFFLCLRRKQYEIYGKTVLITGAARGLGRELAQEFSREGCNVMCVDIDTAGNEETAQIIMDAGGKAKAYTCDLTKRDLVFELANKVAHVDILINNAGIIPLVSLLDASEEQLTRIMNINTMSHFWTLQAFLPDMMKRNRGHVVAIASMGGLLGIANSIAYSTSKFAIVGLMSALYEELRERQSAVKLSCVCPYFIRTVKEIDNNCKLRVPAMEISYAAQEIIRGVKQEIFLFTVPRCFLLFIRLSQFCSQGMQNALRDIFYCKVTLSKQTEF